MNDYKLINSLLKDGSEASLLKLKMIVNFEELYYSEIHGSNIFKLVSAFKEILEIKFATNPYEIQYFQIDKRIKIVEMFKESFAKGYEKDQYSILCIPEDKRNKVKEMFPNIKFP